MKFSATLILLLLIGARCVAATYHVDASRPDNSGNGLTEGAAWKTLAFAKANSGANDTVKLKCDERWTEIWTFPANGMTLTKYGDGEWPIIDAEAAREDAIDTGTTTSSTTEYVHLKNGIGVSALYEAHFGSHILRHFIAEGHADANVSAGADAHIDLSYGLLAYAGDEGLTLHTTASATGRFLTFLGNATAINVSGTAMDLTVEDSYFSGQIVADLDIGSGNFTFARNRFLGPVSGDTSFKFYQDNATARVTLDGNLWDFSPAGATVSAEFVIQGEVTMRNNTLYGGGSKGKFSVTTGGTATVTNTIFSGLWSAGQTGQAGTLNLDFCLRHNIGAGGSAATSDTNAITPADPLFVSAATGNFRLQAGSPAINAGTPLGLTTDLAGRAVGNPPEIGAYEYYAGGNVTAGNLSVGTLSIGP